MTSPHVFSLLDLHSGHLPSHLYDDLNGIDGVTADRRRDYGWFMWVPLSGLDEHVAEYGVPAEIVAVWRYAARHDCSYVLFDIDAEVDPNLPHYADAGDLDTGAAGGWFVEPLHADLPTFGPFRSELDASDAMDQSGVSDDVYKIVNREVVASTERGDADADDDRRCPCGAAHTIAEHGYDPDNES